MTSRQTLQRLMLDLIAPRPMVHPATLAALTATDWDQLLRMARQHRLEPLLHWQLTRVRTELPIPRAIGAEFAARAKHSTVRSLVLQRELILIHRLLGAAGIPYQAMKGAFLALHAYPQPALRPMRDLDILVPRSDALRAFEVLCAGGLVRPERYRGTPEAQIMVHKHLPPLMSASGQVMVEVHARLHDMATGVNKCPLADPSDDPDYWQRGIRRTTGREALCFPSPTDLLLTLIVHAALDHRFSNGPLILSDIAYLLATEPIDWDAFWWRAERDGRTRACWLTLCLAERYWCTSNIVWPDPAPGSATAQSALETAALLMLRDARMTSDVGFAHALGQQDTLRDRLGLMLRRLFPSRLWIAGAYPVRPTSPRVYLYYVPHLWRLLRHRLPRILKRPVAHSELDQLAEVTRWLET